MSISIYARMPGPNLVYWYLSLHSAVPPERMGLAKRRKRGFVYVETAPALRAKNVNSTKDTHSDSDSDCQMPGGVPQNHATCTTRCHCEFKSLASQCNVLNGHCM